MRNADIAPSKAYPPDSNVNARYSYREMILFDGRLSIGAICLYMALDDYARMQGVCWPRWQTLTQRLGWKRRFFAYRLRELRDAGHVRVEQLRYGSRFHMAWYAAVHDGAPQQCTGVHCSPYIQASQGKERARVTVLQTKTSAQMEAYELLMHPGAASGRDLERARKVYNGEWRS